MSPHLDYVHSQQYSIIYYLLILSKPNVVGPDECEQLQMINVLRTQFTSSDDVLEQTGTRKSYLNVEAIRAPLQKACVDLHGHWHGAADISIIKKQHIVLACIQLHTVFC